MNSFMICIGCLEICDAQAGPSILAEAHMGQELPALLSREKMKRRPILVTCAFSNLSSIANMLKCLSSSFEERSQNPHHTSSIQVA